MRSGPVLVLVTSAVFPANATLAFPDGAPWGAANPHQEEHCATCHFGTDPVHDSDALAVTGLPPRPVPGARYELQITFEDPDAIVAGFQLLAVAPGHDAGTFSSTGSRIESIGAAVRSTALSRNDGGIAWKVEWQPPGDISSPIVFYVAATAANDDESPLGDRVHYRTYKTSTE